MHWWFDGSWTVVLVMPMIDLFIICRLKRLEKLESFFHCVLLDTSVAVIKLVAISTIGD